MANPLPPCPKLTSFFVSVAANLLNQKINLHACIMSDNGNSGIQIFHGIFNKEISTRTNQKINSIFQETLLFPSSYPLPYLFPYCSAYKFLVQHKTVGQEQSPHSLDPIVMQRPPHSITLSACETAVGYLVQVITSPQGPYRGAKDHLVTY